MDSQIDTFRAFAPLTGRPTREQSRQRHEDLLDGALEIFLAGGFEMTTMEGIAAATGVTKRTIYRRYPDKRALFLATVDRAIAQWLLPVDRFAAVEVAGDLEATLLAVARLRVSTIVSPAGLRLQRIIYAEAFRFPELAERYQRGVQPAIDYLVDLFRRHDADGLGTPEDPTLKALTFLSVVGAPTRAIILGQPTDPATIDDQVERAVRLLLCGLCHPARTGSA